MLIVVQKVHVFFIWEDTELFRKLVLGDVVHGDVVGVAVVFLLIDERQEVVMHSVVRKVAEDQLDLDDICFRYKLAQHIPLFILAYMDFQHRDVVYLNEFVHFRQDFERLVNPK